MAWLLGVAGESSLPVSDMESSISEEWIPRWWDRRWCLTMVVFLQKLSSRLVPGDMRILLRWAQVRAYLFKQPSWAHLYGRLPVWMRRCLARLDDCAGVSRVRRPRWWRREQD